MRRGGLIIDAIEGSDLLSEHPRRWAEVIVVGTPDAGSASGGVAGVVPRPAFEPDRVRRRRRRRGRRYRIDLIGIAPFFLYRHSSSPSASNEGEPVTLVINVAYGQGGDLQIELVEQSTRRPPITAVGRPAQAHHGAVWTTTSASSRRTARARMWGSASGRRDECFAYLAPSGPGPMIEVVEVLPNAAARRNLAYHALD